MTEEPVKPVAELAAMEAFEAERVARDVRADMLAIRQRHQARLMQEIREAAE